MPAGWRLAPAYDLNPNPARRTHSLRLNETSDLPDPEALLSTAAYYRVEERRARQLLAELRSVTATWRKRARAARLLASEIALVEPAFALSL